MKKPIILCVDDEKIILTSLKEQLKRHFGEDYSVETVESGEEALELLQEFQSEPMEMPVVIADQIMPGIKGDELLRQIHGLRPKTLKIMLTGQANADAVGKAVNYAKLYRYIAKPWDETDLKLTVTEALRSYFQDKKLEEQNLRLQQLNRELEQWNATLEQQVQERTAELEAQKIELKQKNEQLYELNASKDKFFSIISHDLRSPFTVMLGFSQMLEENIVHYTPEQVQDRVHKLRVSAEQLYALLENLLAWSRLQRGVMEHNPEQINLAEITLDNFDLIASKAEQKQIRLKNWITDGTLGYADYNMINTVIRNLISNAVKFTDNGGSIEISARAGAPGLLEIAIADTGTGIRSEDLPKLFRIDVKYSNLGTDGEKGTGLGLNLCKDLVEKNGGQIWVESEVGKGTTFRFTLPQELLNA